MGRVYQKLSTPYSMEVLFSKASLSNCNWVITYENFIDMMLY